MSVDDRAAVRDYYDRLGAAERDRLTADPAGRASLEVHRRFLARFVRPGDRVLEVGAGPGVFTAELARLGATVVVTDLSPVQLELNREHVGGTPAEAALRGLLRVTRPGGAVVASVMSTLGTWRSGLRGVVALAEKVGEDANDLVLTTGDLRHVPGAAHVCRMFRAAEVRALATAAGGQPVAMSASHWASLGDPAALAVLEGDAGRWARFLDHEVAACAEPGALDGGTHVLVAVRA
jgi:SAM-dependent methyltransferase